MPAKSTAHPELVRSFRQAIANNMETHALYAVSLRRPIDVIDSDTDNVEERDKARKQEEQIEDANRLTMRWSPPYPKSAEPVNMNVDLYEHHRPPSTIFKVSTTKNKADEKGHATDDEDGTMRTLTTECDLARHAHSGSEIRTLPFVLSNDRFVAEYHGSRAHLYTCYGQVNAVVRWTPARILKSLYGDKATSRRRTLSVFASQGAHHALTDDGVTHSLYERFVSKKDAKQPGKFSTPRTFERLAQSRFCTARTYYPHYMNHWLQLNSERYWLRREAWEHENIPKAKARVLEHLVELFHNDDNRDPIAREEFEDPYGHVNGGMKIDASHRSAWAAGGVDLRALQIPTMKLVRDALLMSLKLTGPIYQAVTQRGRIEHNNLHSGNIGIALVEGPIAVKHKDSAKIDGNVKLTFTENDPRYYNDAEFLTHKVSHWRTEATDMAPNSVGFDMADSFEVTSPLAAAYRAVLYDSNPKVAKHGLRLFEDWQSAGTPHSLLPLAQAPLSPC